MVAVVGVELVLDRACCNPQDEATRLRLELLELYARGRLLADKRCDLLAELLFEDRPEPPFSAARAAAVTSSSASAHSSLACQ